MPKQPETAMKSIPRRGRTSLRPLTLVSTIVVDHPWRVVIAGLLFLAAAGIFGGPVAGLLQGGGFQDPRAESVLAGDRLRAATGVNGDFSVIALLRLDQAIDSPSSQAEIESVNRTLAADPKVVRVDGLANTHSPAFVSHDQRSTYLVASVSGAVSTTPRWSPSGSAPRSPRTRT
jgi:RND superfamily putative drug exporter